MSDSTNPLSAFKTLAAQNSSAANKARPLTVDLSQSFQQILVSTLLNGGSNGADQAGDGQAALFPLMVSLLEQLAAQQLEEGNKTSSDALFFQTGDSYQINGFGINPASTFGNISPSNSPSGRPVGGTLTQNFHNGHNGLDFGVPVGTSVKSTMDGKVVYAGWNNQGYGNLVIVENGPYRTYYAHLSSIPVKVGDSVASGSVIGLSGNTGNSTGPHLHYEIRYQMEAINPSSLTLNKRL